MVDGVTYFLFLWRKSVMLSLCFSPFFPPIILHNFCCLFLDIFLPASLLFLLLSFVSLPSLAFFRMHRWGVVPSAHWGLGMELWLDARSDTKVIYCSFTSYYILPFFQFAQYYLRWGSVNCSCYSLFIFLWWRPWIINNLFYLMNVAFILADIYCYFPWVMTKLFCIFSKQDIQFQPSFVPSKKSIMSFAVESRQVLILHGVQVYIQIHIFMYRCSWWSPIQTRLLHESSKMFTGWKQRWILIYKHSKSAFWHKPRNRQTLNSGTWDDNIQNVFFISVCL